MTRPRPRHRWLRGLWTCGLFLRQNWTRLALCLPAVLVGTGALAFALNVWATPEERVTARYAAEAQRRFQAKDFRAAHICFERLAQLQEWKSEYRYGLGMTLEALNKPGRAEAILDPLAPAKAPGYGPAQFWKARQLLRGGKSGREDIEPHLKRAVEDQPDSVEANTLLGQFYLAAGELKSAVPYLEKAALTRPELLLMLSVNTARSNRDVARRYAERALETFRSRVEDRPDDHDARLAWANAALLLEDYPRAAAILNDGLNQAEDPRYHQALARVFATRSDALARDPKASLGDRLAMLEEALKQDPNDELVLVRLLELIRTEGPEAERGRAALRGLLADGKATAIVHFTLGLDAWGHGKIEQARLHWEQAHRLAPQIPVVANNLAWVLAHSQKPDLPRALTLINEAIERWPNDPRCRDTRGQILVKLGRWKEALPDLELALKASPDSKDLHRALAETYDHLGDPDLAAEHRRRADVKPEPKGDSQR